MPTSEQAIRACVLAEFLTTKNLPIRRFKYLKADKLIRIEAGFREKQIRIIINEYGRFKYV